MYCELIYRMDILGFLGRATHLNRQAISIHPKQAGAFLQVANPTLWMERHTREASIKATS
jgi:hypothetical protein